MMEYLSYLGYAEQEVGFAAFDRKARWGLHVAGPAPKEIVRYMESGNMMMPALRMTRIERIFSFGDGKELDFDETLESIEDEEEGEVLPIEAKDFYSALRKAKPRMLFRAIFGKST